MVRCEVVMSLQLQRVGRFRYCIGQPIESECRVLTAAAKGDRLSYIGQLIESECRVLTAAASQQ